MEIKLVKVLCWILGHKPVETIDRSAANLLVGFNFSCRDEQTILFNTGVGELPLLESSQVRSMQLNLTNPYNRCSSNLFVEKLEVNIQCAENVTESLSPQFSIAP